LSRDPILCLEDIEKSCTKILRHTEGLKRDSFFSDEIRFDGVLFNLHVIGEAVKSLADELRELHPDIAWREIAGMRDIISHAYFALDLDILWDAIRNDVPGLLKRVRDILKRATPGRQDPPD
jgi:uncharacterized protein with HEPN domain